MSNTTKINDGGPAFPSGDNSKFGPHGGMSLREWYAAQALTQLIAQHPTDHHNNGQYERGLAVRAIRFADALIAETRPAFPFPTDAAVVFRDGNSLVAVRLNHINLQESPAGFGDTADAAIAALVADEAKAKA